MLTWPSPWKCHIWSYLIFFNCSIKNWRASAQSYWVNLRICSSWIDLPWPGCMLGVSPMWDCSVVSAVQGNFWKLSWVTSNRHQKTPSETTIWSGTWNFQLSRTDCSVLGPGPPLPKEIFGPGRPAEGKAIIRGHGQIGAWDKNKKPGRIISWRSELMNVKSLIHQIEKTTEFSCWYSDSWTTAHSRTGVFLLLRMKMLLRWWWGGDGDGDGVGMGWDHTVPWHLHTDLMLR